MAERIGILKPEAEADIMRDCYKLLKHYSRIPEKPSDDDRYWSAFCADLEKLAQMHDNNVLALKVGCAILEYLEERIKERNKSYDI